MKNWLFLIIGAALLVGCRSIQSEMVDRSILDWQYADLRLLDPIDTSLAENDAIAFYTRMNDQSFEMRIDFLATGILPDNDIYVAFDTNPGGRKDIPSPSSSSLATDIAWDYLLKIPASGKVEFINDRQAPLFGTSLFIVRERSLDSIIFTFNHNSLPLLSGKTKIQVLITPRNGLSLLDRSDPFSLDTPSPPRANVLFVFWNTFSAKTPAQALRSWDGAHSGPERSRHGLRYLIDAVDRTHIPVTLLDLATPDTLSALDYLGALPRINSLQNKGYLDIPGYTLIAQNNIDDIYNNIRIITNKEVLYLMENRSFIIGGNDYAQYLKECPLYASNDLLPINAISFNNDCKKLLISSAVSHPSLPVLLGGDFSKSMLGNPSVGPGIFAYIKSHPWIQVIGLGEYEQATRLDFNVLPTQVGENSTINGIEEDFGQLQGIPHQVYQELLTSPANPLTSLAWSVFDALTIQTDNSPAFAHLQSNYIGQIGEIISAARWAGNPKPITSCNDLDYDGKNECILASDHIFVIVEPEGGYIPFVFSMDSQGVHQIIGPTWEFVVGLSDPSTWSLSPGVRSDSDQVLGEMAYKFNNWKQYDYILVNNKITLYCDNMTMRKTVIVNPNGIQIELEGSNTSPGQLAIPLVLDPWVRFTTGWGSLYQSVQRPDSFSWSVVSNVSVEITSTNKLYSYPFNATQPKLSYPEDPNYDYTAGHYLPFPMALVEVDPTEHYSVTITINPK